MTSISHNRERVFLVAPSKRVTRKELSLAIRRLQGLDFEVSSRKDILLADAYFAGSVERRVSELHQAFADSRSSLLVAVHGGYACMELLPALRWGNVLRSRKAVVGCSDVSALLVGLFERGYAGMLVHAPMPASSYWPSTFSLQRRLLNCLRGEDMVYAVPKNVFVRSSTQFKGVVVGGNLRVLTHLLGTPFELRTEGRVIFFEDVRETPAALYTMLLQWFMLGKLKGIKALILGRFAESGKYAVLLKMFMARLEVPVLLGVPLGHVVDSWVIRLGDTMEFFPGSRTVKCTRNTLS